MPIDPSIISNAFANASNNTPDVNALMQQRIQGAENIYKIEAGRQEQAAEAEKEAAQQAAEAMLPAVASAFSDPSDAGLDAAASMLPPEVSQAFTPFLQRLKAVRDPKMRMTILRAELAKDDEGQYILGQLEPTANMRLQAETAAGSQSLAERRLALDIQKAEAEAAGGGKVAQWITGDDGTVTGLDAQGNIVSTVPGIGKKTSATGPDGVKLKPGERLTSEGNVEAVPGSEIFNKQKAKQTVDYKGATTVVDKIAEAQAKIDRITSEDNSSGFAGNFGGYNAAYGTQYFPGQTQDVASDIESLKADLKNAGLELIRNGGSIGQITEREWPIIEQQLASLTPMLSEAKARDILANVSARLKNISDRALETYDMQWGDTQFYAPVTAKPVTSGAAGNTPPAGGGGQDTNGDGVIDFNDLN
jgi:hypothetical protein